jgi:hypothetical protein
MSHTHFCDIAEWVFTPHVNRSYYNAPLLNTAALFYIACVLAANAQ